MSFPERFLWGAGTSAHQVEGGNVYNDSWVLEHVRGGPYVEPSGDACDHYHRYRDDIALLAELGLNTYRFSLEWSRIEPEEGEFSRAALEHYRRVLAACHEYGITPMVTFHHVTSPRWLAAAGGWEANDTPERFGRFCGRVMAHLGDLIPFACTINEANLPRVLAAGAGLERDDSQGWWREAAGAVACSDPDRFVPFVYAASERGRETIMAAHRSALQAIKSVSGDAVVGITLALHAFEAAPGGNARMEALRRWCEDEFLEAIEGDDYVGVQTYTRLRIGRDGVLPAEEGVERTQMGYEYWPDALEASIRRAVEVTGLPVIVTENGIATDDDTRRVEFIERAVGGVARCLEDGLDVRGYVYWSALDNFEWILGYRPTFGLIAVDRRTQERTVKPSARRLGEIARQNGLC